MWNLPMLVLLEWYFNNCDTQLLLYIIRVYILEYIIIQGYYILEYIIIQGCTVLRLFLEVHALTFK
jgi:hypothetical protein